MLFDLRHVCGGHIIDIETTATVSLSIDKRDSVGIIHGIITFFLGFFDEWKVPLNKNL